MAPPEVIAHVRDMAKRGARLAPDEARAVSLPGHVQAMQGDDEGAEARIALACRLTPSSRDIRLDKALVCLSRGRHGATITRIGRAEAMQPLRDVPNLHALRGETPFHLGRSREAKEAFLRIPDMPVRRHLWMAALATLQGEAEEARSRIALFRVGMPGADPIGIARQTYVHEHPADAEMLPDGIRRAMAGG